MALYGQDDWTLREGAVRLSVSPGARLDYDSQFGLHGTPHLAFRVAPLPALTVRALGGAGYRAPEFKELYLEFNHASYGYELSGNPNLQPETSLGSTLDVEWQGPVQLHAQGWWHEVTNLIDPELVSEGTSSQPAQYTYANVGRAASRGAAGSVVWKRPGPIGGAVSYTYTNAWNRTDRVPLDGKAPHSVSASVEVRPAPTLSLFASLDWTAGRSYTLDNATTYAPATSWVDTRAAWTAAPGVDVEAGVHNLLDARDDAYRVLAPRTYYVGIHATGHPFAPKEHP